MVLDLDSGSLSNSASTDGLLLVYAPEEHSIQSCEAVRRLMPPAYRLALASEFHPPSMQAPAKNILLLYSQPARTQSSPALTGTWPFMSHFR